jgi:hypothetical protein
MPLIHARFFSLFGLVFSLTLLIGCGDVGDDDDEDIAPFSDDTASADDATDDVADDAESIFSILVGFAKEDITPEESLAMAGYGTYFFSENNLRMSTGAHDPLWIHAIAMEDANGVPVILLSYDLVGVITTEVKQIQAGIAQELNMDEDSIIVCSTHNHHGPDTIGLWGVVFPPVSGRDPDYIATVVAKGIQAGVEAWDAREPAVMKYASTREPRHHWNNVFLDPDRLIDDTLTMLYVYGQDGKMMGSMMNWSAHPTVMGPDNTEYSADYPGGYYQAMEDRFGGTHLYINGAIGAQIQPLTVNEPLMNWLTGDAKWEDVTEFGLFLAGDAAELLSGAKIIEEPKIWFLESREISVVNMNPLFYLAGASQLIAREVPPVGETGTTYMTTFALGPIAFGTIPGEYAPDYAFEMRDIMLGDAQFIIGLGMDWIGYAVKPDQYTKLAYIYERMLCPSRYAGEEAMSVYRELYGALFNHEEEHWR